MDSVPAWVESIVDIDRPNSARIYDYLLGGSHNFEVDRVAAEQLTRVMPEAVPLARLNRDFLRRVVTDLVHAGVRQFLDLGSGIPTVGNVHEVAHRIDPSCRVVYVDIEPVAVQHARALVADSPIVAAVHADLCDPGAVLTDPVVLDVIDLDQPLAVLMLAVLHFVPASADPARAVAGYRDNTVPGSYLAISHGGQQDQPAQALAGMKQGEQVYQRTATPFVNPPPGWRAADHPPPPGRLQARAAGPGRCSSRSPGLAVRGEAGARRDASHCRTAALRLTPHTSP